MCFSPRLAISIYSIKWRKLLSKSAQSFQRLYLAPSPSLLPNYYSFPNLCVHTSCHFAACCTNPWPLAGIKKCPRCHHFSPSSWDNTSAANLTWAAHCLGCSCHNPMPGVLNKCVCNLSEVCPGTALAAPCTKLFRLSHLQTQWLHNHGKLFSFPPPFHFLVTVIQSSVLG